MKVRIKSRLLGKYGMMKHEQIWKYKKNKNESAHKKRVVGQMQVGVQPQSRKQWICDGAGHNPTTNIIKHKPCKCSCKLGKKLRL